MTAEPTHFAPTSGPQLRAARAVRPVAGVLGDGTPFYAPIGEVVTDGVTVTCHLCGRSLKSVSAHLSAHGWTKTAYCDAFGLERGQSLEGQETRKRRAGSFAPPLVFGPGGRGGGRRPRAGGRARAPPRPPPARAAAPQSRAGGRRRLH